MQSKTSSTISLVAGIAFALLLTLAFSTLSGCDGNEKEKVSEKALRTESPRQTPLPTPIAESTPSLAETESIIVTPPEPPKPVTYEEAESLYKERRYTEATTLFAAFTERKADNPWGHYMLGLSAWKSNDFETAEAAFVRALELDPDHVKSLLNLSRVYLDSERAEEALVRIEEALVLDPLFGVTYRLQGRAFHELARLEEAADAYREAIRIDEKDAWAMNNLALILMEDGFHELALAPLARATELRDDVAIFFNNLGMALEHTAHIRAAEEAYGKAIAIDDSYDKAVQNFARVELVEEDANLAPIDLQTLAQDFVKEIITWSDENIPREEPVAVIQAKAIEPVPEQTAQNDSTAIKIEKNR